MSTEKRSDQLTEDEQFFFDHAGWSYQPATETPEQGRARCARELAKAEEWAQASEVRFEWLDDWSVGDHQAEYDCYEEKGPETCETCILWFGGEVFASLGCIDDATDAYRRVIEAELADEARFNLNQQLAAAL